MKRVSMVIKAHAPKGCCVTSANSHFQVPVNPHGGLTGAEIKELSALKKKHNVRDECICLPGGTDYGPHVGTSCGMRMLRWLRFQNNADAEQKKKTT